MDGAVAVWNTSPSQLVEATPAMSLLLTVPLPVSALAWFPSGASPVTGVCLFGVMGVAVSARIISSRLESACHGV
jgi:hypothetical protein